MNKPEATVLAIGIFCATAVIAFATFSIVGCEKDLQRLKHEDEQSRLRIQEETQKTIQKAIDTGETVIAIPFSKTR